MEMSAEISACRRYRYALWRKWAAGPQVLFLMLNPSIADGSVDDPTIRRCIGFARSWGFGSLAVGNLFAVRTPDPIVMKRSSSPVGPENDARLRELQDSASLVVAAWGNDGAFRGRSDAVRGFLRAPHVLGLTRLGQPRHPLYVASTAVARPWRPDGSREPTPPGGQAPSDRQA